MAIKRDLFSLDIPFDHAHAEDVLEQICREFDFIDVGSIGKSILGRSIRIITIGKGKKNVLFVGGHHGMEWITSAILYGFILDFCNEYKRQNTIYDICTRILFETRTIYIVPMLNPDGIDYAIHGVDKTNPLCSRVVGMNGSDDFSCWQANARGVDLNHNYNAGFAEYKHVERDLGILSGAPTKFSGEYAESEPETRALCNFCRSRMPELALTLHTQGEEIFYTSNCYSADRSLQLGDAVSCRSEEHTSELQSP